MPLLSTSCLLTRRLQIILGLMLIPVIILFFYFHILLIAWSTPTTPPTCTPPISTTNLSGELATSVAPISRMKSGTRVSLVLLALRFIINLTNIDWIHRYLFSVDWYWLRIRGWWLAQSGLVWVIRYIVKLFNISCTATYIPRIRLLILFVLTLLDLSARNLDSLTRPWGVSELRISAWFYYAAVSWFGGFTNGRFAHLITIIIFF